MLDLPAPGRIYGAVEINTGHEFAAARSAKAAPGSWLQIQPGRDRLHDNDAFNQLRNLVRFSLDFYANRYRAREARIAEEQRSRERATTKQERALRVLDRNRSAMPAAVYHEVKQEVREALKASKSEERALDQRAALLAPLASTGMIALALNHELAREIRFLDKGASDLKRLAKKHGASLSSKLSPKNSRREVASGFTKDSHANFSRHYFQKKTNHHQIASVFARSRNRQSAPCGL